MPEQLRVGLGNLGGFQGLLSTSVWVSQETGARWAWVVAGGWGARPLTGNSNRLGPEWVFFGTQPRSPMRLLIPQSRIMITDIAALQLCAKTGLCAPQQEASAEVQHGSFFGAECCGRGEQYLLVDQKNC